MEFPVPWLFCMLAVGVPATLCIDQTGESCPMMAQCTDEFSRKANSEDPGSVCSSYKAYIPCLTSAAAKCRLSGTNTPLTRGRIICLQKCPPDVCKHKSARKAVTQRFDNYEESRRLDSRRDEPSEANKASMTDGAETTGATGKGQSSFRGTAGVSGGLAGRYPGTPEGSPGPSPGSSRISGIFTGSVHISSGRFTKPTRPTGIFPGSSGKPTGSNGLVNKLPRSTGKSPKTSGGSMLSTRRSPMIKKHDRSASVPGDDEDEATKTTNEVNNSGNGEPTRTHNDQVKTGKDNTVGSKNPSWQKAWGLGGGTMQQGTDSFGQEGGEKKVDLREGTMREGTDGFRQEGKEEIVGIDGSWPQGKRKGDGVVAKSTESKAAANNTGDVEVPPNGENKLNSDKDTAPPDDFGTNEEDGFGENEEDAVLKTGADDAEDDDSDRRNPDQDAIGIEGGMRHRSSDNDLGGNLEPEPLANQTGNSTFSPSRNNSAENLSRRMAWIVIRLVFSFVISELLSDLHLE